MKDIILFGAGFYGQNAYYKFKDKYNIMYFVDNNEKLHGEKLHGISIIDIKELKKVYSGDIDIIICSKSYFQISAQLVELGIKEYYVLLEGFLYHSDMNDTMIPVELENHKYYKKLTDDKAILYVQNAACIRTHKIATMMKKYGYKVYLLYTMAPPDSSNSDFASLYDGIFSFTTANGVKRFIANSEFDIIHCSNTPDILANIAITTGKKVVVDTHDMNSLWGKDSINELILEFMANKFSEGDIYTSEKVTDIAEKKYNLKNKKVWYLENMILDEIKVDVPYPKLSKMDGEIHCVYEGGINGSDQESDRFFEKIWGKIVENHIHVHFYSQSVPEYCKYLDATNEYLHYGGNIGTNQLIKEMTKYDCGLAIFNVNKKNQLFMETGTANKMYEYVCAGLPVVVGNIHSYREFVDKYGVGGYLDLDNDIKLQLDNICKITIPDGFLSKNHLTMMSKSTELANFYEQVMTGKDL